MNWTFFGNTFLLALKGIPITLFIALGSLLISLPFSYGIARIRMKKKSILSKILGIYVSYMRGVPIIVQIFLVYSTLPRILNAFFEKYQINIDVFNINPLNYAMLIFTLNTIAIVSELIRSALQSVDKSQMEAALCVGMTPTRAMIRIIIPQAFVVAIPMLYTRTIEMVKATSLVFFMTVQDIIAIVRIEAGREYNYIEAYAVAFIIYLLLCIAITIVYKYVEKRIDKRKIGVSA